MSMLRGASSLAVVAFLASTSAAHAEPMGSLGFDFTSEVWSVADGSVDDAVLMVNFLDQRAVVGLEVVREGATCDALLAAAPGATPRSTRHLAKERAVLTPRGLIVCRESRGRRIDVTTQLRAELPADVEEGLIVQLLDELDRALAAQSTLTLPVLGWKLGPRFARWQPVVEDGFDQLVLVGPTEVPTSVTISSNELATCARMNPGAYARVKRPAFVPEAYAAEVLTGVVDGATSTLACVDHGVGRYEVTVRYRFGAKTAPDAKTEASVTELLDVIARAIAASRPLTDAVTEASEVSVEEPEVTYDNSPEAAARRLAMVNAMQAGASGSVEEPAAASTASSTGVRSTRGWWAESPYLSLQLRHLTFDGTMAVAAGDAAGGALVLARPLAIGDVGAYEWSGAIGYDELSGVSYDVRAGGAMRLAEPLDVIAGAGVDGWRGGDGGVALPTAPYLVVGGRLLLGSLSLRAEYLPRYDGPDEKRFRADFTKLRTGRKIVVEINMLLIDAATVLTFGVGVGV